VELIVSVDDDSFPAVSVQPYVGYKQYGVSGRFKAKTSHEVKLTFQANLGPAHIDGVVLHIVGFTEEQTSSACVSNNSIYFLAIVTVLMLIRNA